MPPSLALHLEPPFDVTSLLTSHRGDNKLYAIDCGRREEKMKARPRWLIAALFLAGPLLVVSAPHSGSAVASTDTAKKSCHLVKKKVHGKKKRVKVCTAAKPKPTATATPSPTSTPTPPSIKEAATTRGIDVAVPVTGQQLVWPQFETTLANNFTSIVVTDTDWKSATTGPDFRPDPNTYNFTNIDPQVDFAQSHNLKITMRLLQGINGSPDWLKNGNYTQDQMRQFIADDINDVMNRYEGKVSQYIVVSEPVPQSWEPGQDPFSDSLGDTYIDFAFKTARMADPSATLTFTPIDTMDPTSPGYAWSLDTVKRLRTETVSVGGKTYPLVDRVELEFYIDAAKPPAQDQLINTITAFQQLGVDVEIDLTVAINNLTGSQQQNLSTQAEIYKMATTVAATHGVKGIIIWGLTDQASFPPGGQAVLFDNNFNPKPAYEAIVEGLEAAP